MGTIYTLLSVSGQQHQFCCNASGSGVKCLAGTRPSNIHHCATSDSVEEDFPCDPTEECHREAFEVEQVKKFFVVAKIPAVLSEDTAVRIFFLLL